MLNRARHVRHRQNLKFQLHCLRVKGVIQFLRHFDDKIFTTHPSESLAVENLRLEVQFRVPIYFSLNTASGINHSEDELTTNLKPTSGHSTNHHFALLHPKGTLSFKVILKIKSRGASKSQGVTSGSAAALSEDAQQCRSKIIHSLNERSIHGIGKSFQVEGCRDETRRNNRSTYQRPVQYIS
jgi:hypothetical protein